MEHTVSVIIPVYNRQNVVEECVHSILVQSYQNFEIILIDDGSTDQTLTLCREMAANDSRIRIIEQRHNGVSIARNLGLDAAVGEFVFFVDSDDVIHPHLMATLVRGMIRSGAAMAGTNVVGTTENNWHLVRERLSAPASPGETSYHTNAQALNAMLTGQSPLGCIGGVMLRRTLIGDTRFRSDLFIGEDFFFIYENLIKGADVEFLKQNWYYVRHHERNSSWNYGYDGFYTRLLRRVLVWKSEDALGRPEYAARQKQDALWVFFLCVDKQETTRADRRKMRVTMKRYEKDLLPALTTPQKAHYFLAVRLPFLYSPKLLSFLSKLKHKLRKPHQN